MTFSEMIIFLFLTSFVTTTLGSPDGKVIIPSNYSKYYRPVRDRSEIMNISVGLVITRIVDIDFDKSSLDFNVEFIMSWKDELIDIEEGFDDKVELPDISQIWTPDLYIYKMKNFKIKKISQPATWLYLKRNGTVIDVRYIFESAVVIICDAQFSDFPFHKHDCFLKVTSFTKTNSEVHFFPDHDYDSATLVHLTSSDYLIKTSYLTGPDTTSHGIVNASVFYSVVGIKLELYSIWQKYITLYYVPTILIVLTSWIFFLLPSTSYPARTALLVTVFLLLINIFSSVVNETPNTSDGGEYNSITQFNCPAKLHKCKNVATLKAPGIIILTCYLEMTALELWTLACIFTVFGSLLSYGFILSRDQMIIQGKNSN